MVRGGYRRYLSSTTMQPNPRLKTLDGLVQESARRLRKLSEDNRTLKAELDSLKSENERLTRDLKRFQALSTRHDRVKARIEKLIHRLEKAEGVA